MPPETSANDDYLAEVDRLLGLRGRERRRALAAARRRLTALRAQERKSGASESEAEERALTRLGAPEQAAEELRERTLVARARVEAQSVMAAFVLIALAMLVIAVHVMGLRRFHQNGTISFNVGQFGNSWDGFFHYHPRLGFSLPPLYLSAKFILAAALLLLSLVLAEAALAFTRHRRRLSSWLTLAGGAALVTAVSLQIALAFEWHRLRQGHNAWLLAATLVEVVAVLFLAEFLARPARALMSKRAASLVGTPTLVLLAVTPLLLVGAKSGFSATNLCGPAPFGCREDSEMTLAYTANHVVNLELPAGPVGAQGAVALKGRRLAAAVEAWRNQSAVQGTQSGPVDLQVWEGRWPASQPGPCGAVKPDENGDRLSPTTNSWCQVWSPPSLGGVEWKQVARLEGVKTGAVAAAYRSNGRLAVAYSRPNGVWLAEAPFWRPRRLLDARARSIHLVSINGGDLALAAIVARRSLSQLELLRSYGNRWSQPVTAEAKSGLKMVSSGSQLALLFRDGSGRLALERRSGSLALLERRSFGAAARGALGNLRDGSIGAAVATPLPGDALRLRISRVGSRGLIPITSEKLALKAGAARMVELDPSSLVGVVQTGNIVRALYAGFPRGHVGVHVAMSVWLKKGQAVFGSDWPRWAALKREPEEVMTYGRPPKRWMTFTLMLGQPPALQLVHKGDS